MNRDEPRRLDAYRRFLSDADFAQLEEAIRRPLPPAIRINTLKIDAEEARRNWPEEFGWQIQAVPFCPTGWQIVEGGDNLSRTVEHRLGRYYIQDAASMLPVEMFDLGAIERPLILDLAASPGGKTTHLACKTNDAGLILANDTSASRIGALRSNLQDCGAIGVAVTNFPGERFGNWFPETFDAALLDAPCSGEGLRTAERRKTRPVSDKERKQLHHRQTRLLAAAFHAIKPGGQVVYATCTLAPEEDEAVVDALLKAYPRQAAVESVERILPVAAPALTSDGEREFDPQVARAVRLWPHRCDTSGFFAALIRKRDSTPVQTQSLPTRAQPGFEPVSPAEQVRLIDELRQSFGFDLGEVIDRQALVLRRRGKAVYAVPELHLSHFAELPVVAAGLLIGERVEGFVPSHELVSRFSDRFVEHRFRLAGEQCARWLAGYDLRHPDATPYPPGTLILAEDHRGRFLGRGKVLSDRIRNMLPKK